LHKKTAALVSVLAFIATEVLAVKNMTAGRGTRKKGLNREILATSPALFLHMLRAKAEEAGLVWLEVPTRTVKPFRTCSACVTVLGRDENAARVMLNWALNASCREPALVEGPQKRSRRSTKPHLELLLRWSSS